MKRKGLVVWLSFVIMLFTGVAVYAAEGEILEPRIERHPGINFGLYKPEVFPIYSPISRFVYCASSDLTPFDLTNEEENLKNAMFDTETIWPEKMPPVSKFDPDKIMEWAKNPGLGLADLHEKGITGKGVNIAFIDGALYLEHEQWVDRIKMYEEINVNPEWGGNFHASHIVSIGAGNTVGVAPETDIYFVGCNIFGKAGVLEDAGFYMAQAIRRLIDVNKLLPKKDKIRVISISMSPEPYSDGYEEYMSAIREADESGIFVVSAELIASYMFAFYGMDIDLLSDRDDLSSYQVDSWEKWIAKVAHGKGMVDYYIEHFMEVVGTGDEILLIPCDRVVLAGASALDSYIYYPNGGWSNVIPYIAGLYALACQVNYDVTPELFWSKALKTGEERIIEKDGIEYVGKLINPAKLMESLATN